MLIKSIPYIITLAALWYVLIGFLRYGEGKPSEGLYYHVCAILMFTMTALAVWIKH